jgi:hypothetical protein
LYRKTCFLKRINDQKTLDISQYSLELSLVISNYSFFHKSIRLPLVIINLRAFSSIIFNTSSVLTDRAQRREVKFF